MSIPPVDFNHRLLDLNDLNELAHRFGRLHQRRLLGGRQFDLKDFLKTRRPSLTGTPTNRS